MVFFDLKYSQETAFENSKYNLDELDFIEELINGLLNLIFQSLKSKDLAEDFIKGKIGIISPYRSQIRKLKMNIKRILQKVQITSDVIEIDTVDGF